MKGFELCKGRVAQRFLELNLKFLDEEDDAEAGLFDAAIDPSSIETTSDPFEPTVEAPKPIQEPEAVESAPTSSIAAPPEVEDFE